MLNLVTSQRRMCLAAFALCFAAASMLAQHGRNFAGEFQVRNVVDDGSAVQFELHVKVLNFSGADVKDATLALVGGRRGLGADAMEYQGSFTNVSIPYRKAVELDGTFVAPERAYHEWQRGAAPNLVVAYVDGSGNELRSRVELRPALGGGSLRGESR